MSLMDQKDESRHYVKVRADHLPDGQVVPLMFREEDGEKTVIDRVLDARPAPALKAGGQGIRYTCRVSGRCIYLFNDRDRWFIETE